MSNLFPIILSAIQKLAGLCDGASSRDGYGFNKNDTEFGHSLANKDFLSRNQAPYAFRMCRFYKRQLIEYGFNMSDIESEFWKGMDLHIEITIANKGGQYSAEITDGLNIKGLKIKTPEITGADKNVVLNACIAWLKESNMTGKLRTKTV